MSYVLGIDTGGTYTDGVIIRSDSKKIIRKAKAFTTPENLEEGIINCISAMDFDDFSSIDEVHLSTTVAVNAILEKNFESVGLLQIDQEVDGNIPANYQYTLHTRRTSKKGLIDKTLDEAAKIRKVFSGNVKSIVVTMPASQHSIDIERAIAGIVEKDTGIKCVCASDISLAENYLERTVTATLNVFLVPLVRKWIKNITAVMNKYGIAGRISIVDAMGEQISCEEAMEHPLKTIFSGLAASVKGGIALAQEKDFLLIDMGGTSSDVTRIIDGEFRERKRVTAVGEFRVEESSMDVKSYAVGGDSQIKMMPSGSIKIGPQRAVPLCVAAERYPYLKEELLQYKRPEHYEMLTAQDTDCFIGMKGASKTGLNPVESQIAEYLIDNPHNIFFLAERFHKDADALHMDRLVKQRAVQLISLTPTDILHVEGKYSKWNKEIAAVAVNSAAKSIKLTEKNFLKLVNCEMTRVLSEICMRGIAAFEDIEFDFDECPGAAYLLHHYFSTDDPLLKTEFSISRPIVAIGAPAGVWLRAVANKMKTKIIIPEHSEVANAYGAAIAE